MTYIYKQPYLLLLSLTLITSCHGQNKTPQPAQASGPQMASIAPAKMVKTQGTGPYQNVHCGMQDKVGNMWFGTSGEGLYRYDGTAFTNYTEKDGLSSNNICSVLEDKAGNILVGTIKGLCRFDGRSAFTAVPISGTGTHISVLGMIQDRSGILWLGTDKGAYRYDGKSFTHFLDHDGTINKDSLRFRFVWSVYEDRGGNIWFASWSEGACRYDGKSITCFKPNGDGWVHSMLEDKSGNMWFGTREHGVSRHDANSPFAGQAGFTSFSGIGLHGIVTVTSLAEDKAGNIWFGTWLGDYEGGDTIGGVWRYDPSAAAIACTNFTKKDGLADNGIWCILKDRDGNMWVGTRKTSLCRYDGKAFTRFSE